MTNIENSSEIQNIFIQSNVVTINFYSNIGTAVTEYEKQIEDLNGRLTSVNNKLKNENFVDRAPKKIIDHERQKQKNYENDLAKLQKNIASLKE